ncbi:hypothetical protein CR158_03110 [Halomonas heilongjiangensis]|uniref:Common-antigen outer membrane protein n=2 Tax=Halomonas heilongjiangensis TaxID=1387883 RepID=A0A2N7TRG6_9GAMM|nr:hypothetical protein C1H66_05700 [Halomonas heilongjiangensis]PXX93989.1 hypothetical protein CR158_03110 [Halomonas heilongjiangensis]
MSRIVQLLLRRPARNGVVVLGLAMLLGGCAAPGGFSGSQPGGVVQGGRGQPLDENLSGFLSRSPGGAVITLAESPWGRDVEVVADEPYHAASGRECRRLSIVSASTGPQQAVACESAQGWETQRLVTEMLSTGSAR